jgi:hypothetical protein
MHEKDCDERGVNSETDTRGRRSLGEVVEDERIRCKWCGKPFLTKRTCGQHEKRCDEAADPDDPVERNEPGVVVEADAYWTVGPDPDVYHVEADCDRCQVCVEQGEHKDRDNSPDERSAQYVQWKELRPCAYCVTDRCAKVQSAQPAEGD